MACDKGMLICGMKYRGTIPVICQKEKGFTNFKKFINPCYKIVPEAGLEPARLAAHASETCMSTNSITPAIAIIKKKACFGQLK